MNIYESLENLQVSEECFNDILNIVEEILSEKVTVERARKAAEKSIPAREKDFKENSPSINDPDFSAKYDSKEYQRAKGRLIGARRMAQLPKGDNRDYAKLRKGARNVRSDREYEVTNAVMSSPEEDSPEIQKLEDRYEKADLFATDSNGRLEDKNILKFSHK